MAGGDKILLDTTRLLRHARHETARNFSHPTIDTHHPSIHTMQG
jgi:hypothetical protein